MIFLGLFLFLLSVFVWITNFAGFGDAIRYLIQGGILLMVLLIGLVMLIAGLMGLGK